MLVLQNNLVISMPASRSIADGVWQVSDIAIASVFAIVVVAVAAVIVGNLQISFANTLPANSASANVLSSIVKALNPFSSFLGVVILVALAAVLLMILIAAFGRQGIGGSTGGSSM